MARPTELQFRKTAALLLPEHATGVIAVSGGSDSVALAHLMERRARSHSGHWVIAHLDHGLRTDSKQDAVFVEKLSASLGFPFITARKPIRQHQQQGESLEEAARRVRRAFLLDVVAEQNLQFILTAHTLDDQAETILFRWIRGAGPTALSGIQRSGPGPFRRPLLGCTKLALREFLISLNLPWLEDPSNQDLRFDRNRLRQLLIPQIQEFLNPQASAHIVRSMRLLQEDSNLLDEWAETKYSEVVDSAEGHQTLHISKLQQLPSPLARRILRRAMEMAGVDPRRITQKHLTALNHLLDAEGGASLDLPGKVIAKKHRQTIMLGPDEETACRKN